MYHWKMLWGETHLWLALVTWISQLFTGRHVFFENQNKALLPSDRYVAIHNKLGYNSFVQELILHIFLLEITGHIKQV